MNPVRRHEVTTPLEEVLDVEAAKSLDQVVAVRRWDIYKDPFEDTQHFVDYFRKGGAELMWQAARLLGAAEDMRLPVLNYGAAVAMSRYLAAVNALEASGRVPLINGTREGLVKLALNSAADAGTVRSLRKGLPKLARAALLEGWVAKPVLMQIASEPQRVADGTVGISPFRSKFRLLRWS